LGFPKTKALIFPFLAYLSINGPPGYFNPKTLADLSKARVETLEGLDFGELGNLTDLRL